MVWHDSRHVSRTKETSDVCSTTDRDHDRKRRVLFRTEGTRRVISVHGIVFAHYDVTDRAAEAYAMISLFESGYADQNDIARCFGYSTRTLRRYQQRVEVDGLSGLANPRGRPAVNPSDRNEERKLDRTILHLKVQGFSNRVIAGRIGVDERTIRRHLRRGNWIEPSSQSPQSCTQGNR